MANNLENELEGYIHNNKILFYRLAYSYVKNNDDALDVVQESIYKAFSSIDYLRDFSNIKTWFYRIIVNTSLDVIRKRKKEILIDKEFLLNNDTGTVDHYSDLDLERALETLAEKYRSIIILRFFEDLKIEEIAQVLDENVNTIKTRLYKALKVLRISINGENEEA